MLVEWCRARGGLYTVADQSAEPIQRRYFAEAVATRAPGFADVAYPDWRSLLRALARTGLSGPLVIDEVPHLVAACPAWPSLVQNWLDHEAKATGLVLAIAGSSQRMMHGLVLDATAPLFGRAREAMQIQPLGAGHLGEAIGLSDAVACVRAYSVWGGIPWSWTPPAPCTRSRTGC